MKNYIIAALSILLAITILWLAIEIKSHKESISKTVDSTVTTTIDSIPPADTIRIIEEQPSLDSVIRDTVIKTKRDTFWTEPENKYTQIRTYSTEVSDSLVDGTIRSTVQGFLIHQNLSYVAQYPLQIEIQRKTRVNTNIEKTILSTAYPSVGIRTATDFQRVKNFEVTGSWTFQNRNRITYGYSPVQKTHSIGFSYNLRNLFKN